MNNRPLVSIIVPAYNAEKYIEETVVSALRQTYRNIEMIVVDDGSTDHTAEIVKTLAVRDRRLAYTYQKNQGQSAARNAGIARAAGGYVAFLDADDLFLPKKIEEQVRHLEENRDCGVSYCKIYHFYGDQKNKLYYFDVGHPSGYLFGELLRKNFINPLSVLVRKKFLDKYGAFEPSFRRVDEQYLWLKLSHRGVKFCYLDRMLAYYRIHEASLSNEAVYFKETEERFLELLHTVRTWLTPEEAERYGLGAAIRRTRRRLVLGRHMAKKNLFAKLLFALYNMRRKRRLKRVL